MEKVSMNKLEMARRAAKGGSGGTIPPATSETLGGVKIGEGVNVSEDGTISVPSYVPPAYSYEEVDTLLVWVDGKKIYRKCIAVETLPQNTSLTVGTLAALDTLVSIHGEAKSKNQNGYSRPLPFVGNGSNDIRVDISNYDVVITTSNDWSSYSGIIILEYTKAGA